MGAAGTLMGGHLTLIALFYTAIIGAFLAVMMTVWRKDFWAQIAWGFKRLAFWHESKAPPAGYVPTTVPYGLAIAIGCLVALLLERPVA
jgi:Flp pilus assembly protein protease CpaA